VPWGGGGGGRSSVPGPMTIKKKVAKLRWIIKTKIFDRDLCNCERGGRILDEVMK
jgi:hypothetical protein